MTAPARRRPVRLSKVEALVERLGRRAMNGDLAAAREVLKLAREDAAARERAAMEAARAQAGAPLPPPRFDFGSPASFLERTLILLGAVSKAEDQHYPDGNICSGKLTLARWVVDAAAARDPELPARLAGWRWDDVQRACGEG